MTIRLELPLNNPNVNILDLSYDQLKEWLASVNEGDYQADLMAKWVFRRMATNFGEMVDLKPSLNEKLENLTSLTTLKALDQRVSIDGQTRKILLQTGDSKTIETALMSFNKNGVSRERRTVCVSSQVGCAVGCGFCATGQQGFERNLGPGEIVEQVLFFMRLVRDQAAIQDRKVYWPFITHVVFMGMGEPLANFENVSQAIGILNSPRGLNLGVRQITLSTAGLTPQIRQLPGTNLQFELAISLHASTDEVRDRLVPLNRKYPLSELMAACKEYFEKTGRRPFFEYALFAGVNDSLRDAENLVHLLADFKCSVNLIVGNETSSSEYRSSSKEQALAFQKILMAGGLRAMIRLSKGADIEAGCGQLRSRWPKI
jgi:23S rRNA (adenine2503-C2)-methyltransferase